jgi:hypothetical protein
MPGNNRKRQCKTCKVMFASPAAWVKHRDSMGYCRPVTTYPMLNLDYRNGAWCVKVRKSAKR